MVDQGGGWKKVSVGRSGTKTVKVEYEYGEFGWRWKIELSDGQELPHWPVDAEWWTETDNVSMTDKEDEIVEWLSEQFGFNEQECDEVLQVIHDLDT
jgi:hypothetical protein